MYKVCVLVPANCCVLSARERVQTHTYVEHTSRPYFTRPHCQTLNAPPLITSFSRSCHQHTHSRHKTQTTHSRSVNPPPTPQKKKDVHQDKPATVSCQGARGTCARKTGRTPQIPCHIPHQAQPQQPQPAPHRHAQRDCARRRTARRC